jgi:hypothetical protein
MTVSRRLAAVAAVSALVLGGAIAVTDPARAVTGAPAAGAQSPVTDTWGFAGDEAAASTGTNFTHFSALAGAGTQYSAANPALPSAGFLGAPSTTWQTATGGQVFLGLLNVEAAGLQFGAHGNETASLVVVRAGNRSDVVAVIVNQGQVHYDVLASYPMADTVDLDLLHDANSAYTFRGQHVRAGAVAFSTEDVRTGISSVKTIDSSNLTSGGIIRSSFHTALGGVLSGARAAQGGVGSFSADPVPDTTGGIVVRLAHLHLDANANAGEVFSEGFQSGASWDVIPYAASQSNRTVAESTVFAADHISVVELGPQH